MRSSGPGCEIHCLQLRGGRGIRGEIDFVLSRGDEELFLVEVTSGRAGVEEKASFVREVAQDRSVTGRRRVHGIVVAAIDRDTRAEVPAVELGGFLEELVPLQETDPLEPLRGMSVVIREE